MGNIFSTTRKCNICESPEESFETYRRPINNELYTINELYECNETIFEPDRVELQIIDEDEERIIRNGNLEGSNSLYNLLYKTGETTDVKRKSGAHKPIRRRNLKW